MGFDPPDHDPADDDENVFDDGEDLKAHEDEEIEHKERVRELRIEKDNDKW